MFDLFFVPPFVYLDYIIINSVCYHNVYVDDYFEDVFFIRTFYNHKSIDCFLPSDYVCVSDLSFSSDESFIRGFVTLDVRKFY